MTQLLSKIRPTGNPVPKPFHSVPTLKNNLAGKVLFGSTLDGKKGWGFRFPQAFFRKSFTCHAQAACFLTRPIPLFMNLLRRDGLVGKGLLVAWQVSSSFVAGESDL